MKDFKDDVTIETLKRKGPPKEKMKAVDVQMMKATDTFNDDQKKGFEQYYGAHPELVEGSKYFGNSEK
jgi:hypothetical protein